MRRRPQLTNLRRFTLIVSLAAVVSVAPFHSASALIVGGEGNEPMRDPGWPKGATELFNVESRVAYWEGPPFGGGQWHAECRGNTDALNDLLKKFAKLDVKTKRIVAHDGVGRSFWLNPNNKPEKADAAKIDWVFVIWQQPNWEQQTKMPVGLRQPDLADSDDGPPAQIEIYTGGNIRWDDVIVPAGIEVIDQQLESHGYSPEDGAVLEGNISDLADGKPLAARIELQLVESRPKIGYEYTPTAHVDTDAKGHWVLKNAPQGWYRIVASADEYVPRVIGYCRQDGTPRWQSIDTGLSRSAVVAGRVVDAAGKPVADVDVKLQDVASHDKEYESPNGYSTKTDTDGQFRFDQVPIGTARVVPYKAGYCRPGLGETFDTPNEQLSLVIKPAAQLRVTVEFRNENRRGEYLVELEPEGGNVVGSWGGSAQIDGNNQYTFANVPPGRYVLVGHPNPTREDERTERVTVDLKGGATEEVSLKAK